MWRQSLELCECGQDSNIISYHPKSLLGAEEKGTLLLSGKKGVPLWSRESMGTGQRVCSTLFSIIPGLGYFVHKSPSLCTFL